MADTNHGLARTPWKMFLHTSVTPLAIDVFGVVEGGLEQIGVQGRMRPRSTVGAAFGLGCILAVCWRRLG